eukprot:scaffold202210_cov32-Tisochrysis_lutea.AAC.5
MSSPDRRTISQLSFAWSATGPRGPCVEPVREDRNASRDDRLCCAALARLAAFGRMRCALNAAAALSRRSDEAFWNEEQSLTGASARETLPGTTGGRDAGESACRLTMMADGSHGVDHGGYDMGAPRWSELALYGPG